MISRNSVRITPSRKVSGLRMTPTLTVSLVRLLLPGFMVPFTLGACGMQSSPPSATVPATASAQQDSTDFSSIPGQFPSPASLTANGEREAPVGGCVNLSGPAVNAVLTIVDCGSQQYTYRIVQRVNRSRECGDADHSYYRNSKESGQYTACLDLAWDKGACLNLGRPVTKVSCDDPSAREKYKPIKVVVNTTVVDACPNGGYAHPQRRFTVCTQRQP